MTHSFLSENRSGVPGRSFPLRDVISKPKLNLAMPDVRLEHGKNTLNSTKFEYFILIF